MKERQITNPLSERSGVFPKKKTCKEKSSSGLRNDSIAQSERCATSLLGPMRHGTKNNNVTIKNSNVSHPIPDKQTARVIAERSDTKYDQILGFGFIIGDRFQRSVERADSEVLERTFDVACASLIVWFTSSRREKRSITY